MSICKINATMVKELREKSGAPMMDCKKALTEAKGDMEAGLRRAAQAGHGRRPPRRPPAPPTKARSTSYIHAGGKIGVLLEVNCESDFVARTDDFQDLVHDIAMHIAAVDPRYIRREDVTAEDFEREKDIYRAAGRRHRQAGAGRSRRSSKARWRKFYEEVCLLEQPFIKDQTISIQQLIATEGRQARREHHRPPLRPLQGRRSRRDGRRRQNDRKRIADAAGK